MATVTGGSNVIKDGLVLSLDAANFNSYPGSGTTWFDLSGNGINGTLVSGSTFSSSNNGSIVFDGTDDYVSVSQTGNTTSFSYEIFLKPTQVSKDQMYIGYSTLTSNYVRISSSKAFLSIRAGGVQRTLTHSDTLINNQIYHIVSIYNGIQLKIYVNNNLTSGTVINQTLDGWGTSRIGRWTDADQRSFVGDIYCVRIYNRELTSQEILQNYNATKGRFNL